MKHVTRAEIRAAAGREGEEGRALSEIDRAAQRLTAELGKRMRKETLGTGQQIEWRAHLCHLLELPFGALPATRHWAASPDLLVHIATLIRRHRPEVVVECGAGVSTLVAARALALNGAGTVWTLEADADFAELTKERLRRLGLADRAKVRHAPIEALPGTPDRHWYASAAIARLPERIDMLVVDGPQATATVSRAPAIDWLFPRLAPAGLAVFDDFRRTEEQGFARRIETAFPGWSTRELPAEKGALLCLGPEAGRV